MTRGEAKELLPFIKAYSEGKTIQVRTAYDETWNDVAVPQFKGSPNFYRIKPEPRIVPFSFEDVNEILGTKVFKHNVCGVITHVQTNGLYIGPVLYSFVNLTAFKFEDGSICGKIVSE